MTIPVPVWSLVPHAKDLFLNKNFLSPAHAPTFSSHPSLKGDGHVHLASQHTRAGRVPTSPDKQGHHPLQGMGFPPKGRQGTKALERKEH